MFDIFLTSDKKVNARCHNIMLWLHVSHVVRVSAVLAHSAQISEWSLTESISCIDHNENKFGKWLKHLYTDWNWLACWLLLISLSFLSKTPDFSYGKKNNKLNWIKLMKQGVVLSILNLSHSATIIQCLKTMKEIYKPKESEKTSNVIDTVKV